MPHDDKISDELERDLRDGVDWATALLFCKETRLKACEEAYETEIMETIRKTYVDVSRKARLKARSASDPEKAYWEEIDKWLDEAFEAATPKARHAFQTAIPSN
jgi:hypothetical protein